MNFLDEFQVMVRKYPQRAALADCNGERIKIGRRRVGKECRL